MPRKRKFQENDKNEVKDLNMDVESETLAKTSGGATDSKLSKGIAESQNTGLAAGVSEDNVNSCASTDSAGSSSEDRRDNNNVPQKKELRSASLCRLEPVCMA